MAMWNGECRFTTSIQSVAQCENETCKMVGGFTGCCKWQHKDNNDTATNFRRKIHNGSDVADADSTRTIFRFFDVLKERLFCKIAFCIYQNYFLSKQRIRFRPIVIFTKEYLYRRAIGLEVLGVGENCTKILTEVDRTSLTKITSLVIIKRFSHFTIK